MNIQQAIAQIESAVRAYTARTVEGVLQIPVSAQRPIYMEGPPGLGKTAVMTQIAQKMNIGLVSYTMTHHTRQSALGLPIIEKRSFNGVEFSVTEYTMSEIIAEIYRCMEQIDCREGILFLDEINCVSETLLPAMLELLQHKRFGKHSLPEGWIIVCAGNPIQYNRNARVFDAVTLDRIRLMRIEPDLEAWQIYATESGVHPSIRAYLHLRPDDFYIAEESNIVTPRSWCNLSEMIYALENAGEIPNRLLFEQYLQCESICTRFSLYYTLCENVSKNFQLDQVLFDGDLSAASHFSTAPFDEALCATELLAQRLAELKQSAQTAKERATRLSYFIEAAIRDSDETNLIQTCKQLLERRENALNVRKNVGALSVAEETQEKKLHEEIRNAISLMFGNASPADVLKKQAEVAFKSAKQTADAFAHAKQNALDFAQIAFAGDSFQALLCREILQKNAS